MHYPDTLEIVTHAAPVHASVRVPGSKSLTNRALVLAALASRWTACELAGALRSEDTEVMVECLTRLGFRVNADWPAATIRVERNTSGRVIPARQAELFVGNSGTTMRFVAAMVALGEGTYAFDGVPRMRERPIEDLLAALRRLGVDATSVGGTGCPPVRIRANGFAGGTAVVKSDASSQFLSGLLMAAAFHTGSKLVVQVNGPVVSEPYIDMTTAMLHAWNVPMESHNSPTERWYAFGEQVPVPAGPPSHYTIEPDASAASYFLAAAAIVGGRVEVLGLRPNMLQGDVAFADLLARMGCTLEDTPDGLAITGGPLRGIDVDMNAISDTAMTLAAVACFADGPTRIRNVAHVRHKETDRLAAVACELRKLGATVEEFADGLAIAPGPMRGGPVDTYRDHRMAMSLALIGLRVPGVVVDNPACVAKTYPNFWHDLERLRA